MKTPRDTAEEIWKLEKRIDCNGDQCDRPECWGCFPDPRDHGEWVGRYHPVPTKEDLDKMK